MTQRVFDEQGHVVVAPSTAPLNDLTMAPKFMDEMPEGVMFVPIVIPAADGQTPRIALVHPTLIATTEEVTEKILAAVNAARQEFVDAGVQRDAVQQELIDATAAMVAKQAQQQATLEAAVAAIQAKPSMVKVGEASISYAGGIALGASTRSISTNLAGVLATDRLVIYPKNNLPTGYSISAGIRAGAGSFTATIGHPGLALNAGFAIPVEVWALR